MPIALGISALEAFCELVPRIIPECEDLSEVAAEAGARETAELIGRKLELRPTG